MQIIMTEQPISSEILKPFTSNFDKVFVSIEEEDFLEKNEFKLSKKNIKKLFNVINYSWDGEIYWFYNDDKNIVMQLLKEWFKEDKSHSDFDELCIGNCLLMKETSNCLCIIDTQYDMSTSFHEFLHSLNQLYPNINYGFYSDCHLIDHIKLGRNNSPNDFEDLYFLYKQGIIDNSFFLLGLYDMKSDNKESKCYNLFPRDKEIVITGKLPVLREEIFKYLNNEGYKTSEKINKNSWLWLGNNVGAKKIEQAKEKGAICNTIEEVIDMAFENYLNNKKV